MIIWSHRSKRWATANTLSEIFKAIVFVGIPYKVRMKGGPFVIDFEVTNRCDSNCKYCYVKEKEYLDELSDLETLRILESLYHTGMRVLTLTGGEPLLRKGLVSKIVDQFSGRVLLTLNTSHYFREWEEFIEGFDILRFSCDDLSSKTVVDAKLELLLDFISSRPKNAPDIVINTVVTNENIDILQDHISIAESLKVKLSLLKLENVGDAKDNSNLTKKDFQYSRNYKNNILSRQGKGCLANKGSFVLLPNGKFLRCILNRNEVIESLNDLRGCEFLICNLH